jgi:hypothetical protein
VKLDLRVTVTVEEDGEMPPMRQVKASVTQAIRNALARAEDNGFDHALSEKLSIFVVSVAVPHRPA